MTRVDHWRAGNRVELLINGEEYYPRVFALIAKATQEVLLETFILFDDVIGQELRCALIEAAKRGVRVVVTVDGWGSPDLSREFVGAMTAAGVHFRAFDPQSRTLGIRLHWFRRMHRKLVVIDGKIAFVGGINFSHDHIRDFGPRAKQDYAVEIEGPVVADIHHFMLQEAELERRPARLSQRVASLFWRRWLRVPQAIAAAVRPNTGTAEALFVTRDNRRNRRSIERHYNQAIRAARREVIILNAYFFPGYRFLRNLKNAARRGVKVSLILQGGKADMPWVKWAAGTLYDFLLRGGVVIYEYCERPMHGKVAVIDDDWSTVGSSNLDPLSMFLNLEANLFVRDAAFAQKVRAHLGELMANSCEKFTSTRQPRTLIRRAIGFLAFLVTRQFSLWAVQLPEHTTKPVLMPEGTNPDGTGPKPAA